MLTSLKMRIAIPTIGIALFSAAAMGGLTLVVAKARLTDIARDRMQLAATSQKTSVEMISAQASADLNDFADNPLVASNLPDLAETLDLDKPDTRDTIKAFTASPDPAARLALDGSTVNSMYGRRHVKVQQAAQKLLKHPGYADALFLDEKGVLVYTAMKGKDFAHTLADADLQASGLARLVARLRKAPDGQTLFEDFAPYVADARPAGFIGRSVARKSNVAMGSSQEATRIGYVVLRVSPALFDQTLASRNGLGESGEVFAVGEDGTFRSNPPLLPANTAGQSVVSFGMDAQALKQGPFFDYTGRDGEEKLAAVTPISVLGAHWTLVAEQNRSEALAAISSLLQALLAISLFVVVTTVVLGLYFARNISNPISAMTEAMLKLANQDHGVVIPGTERKDELGAMAHAVLTFKEAGIEKLRLESEAAEAQRAAEDERLRNESNRHMTAREQAMVVGEIARGLEMLASGDLTYRVTQRFPADYEKLRLDFNQAISELSRMIRTVSTNADTIRSGSSEITNAANDLSHRTEHQAASLNETAHALNSITSTIRHTADAAGQAREIVVTAKDDADHGGEVVQQAIAAMTEIEKSSQQIGQIITVINEIALQTNLLALNAGVEAVRAGDAGRGFAVVATEVRALAQRSAEAAKEIKSLISVSTQQVGFGVELVGETGNALNRIVARVGDINRVVSDIAASSREQADELQSLNGRVAEMDLVTQQNAAMVEETTAASLSLTQEVEELAALISRFQFDGNSSDPHVASSRMAA